MLRVVRTRRVRAIDERYYGRTGRTLQIVVVRRPGESETPVCVNELSMVGAESVPAHGDDTLYSTLRHVRIPPEAAAAFRVRVEALVREFGDLPRSGETVYGLVAGLLPQRPTGAADSHPAGGRVTVMRDGRVGLSSYRRWRSVRGSRWCPG